MRPPRLERLGTIAGLTIYLVSGEQVRQELDIDFTMGGNSAIYPYIPKGEIWVDDAAHTLDRMATTLHEIVELHQMEHYGKSYDPAHEVASATERPFRRELAKARSKTFDVRRVAKAYQAYLKDPDRHPIIPRPNEVPTRRQNRVLDREIDAALARTPRPVGKRVRP